MKIKQLYDVLNVHNTKDNLVVKKAIEQITTSILSMANPEGEDKFILFNQKQANGVKPIKYSFTNSLKKYGWELEKKLNLGHTDRPGPIDATYDVGDNKYFAVEWETGNISSSHRALNKMITGILNEQLIGGILILPSREMYYYLTDRVGNFKELQPYLSVYEKANYLISQGYLGIIEIEHDDVSNNIKPIPKGTDGRALV